MKSILQDDSGDLLTKSMAELAHHFPTLEQVIIRERDVYMACKLYQTCRYILASSRNENQTYRLVAIVGAGHVQGICRWLTGANTTTSTTAESICDHTRITTTTPPELILTKLVEIKKKPLELDDVHYLVNDVVEVNPDILKELLQEMQQ